MSASPKHLFDCAAIENPHHGTLNSASLVPPSSACEDPKQWNILTGSCSDLLRLFSLVLYVFACFADRSRRTSVGLASVTASLVAIPSQKGFNLIHISDSLWAWDVWREAVGVSPLTTFQNVSDSWFGIETPKYSKAIRPWCEPGTSDRRPKQFPWSAGSATAGAEGSWDTSSKWNQMELWMDMEWYGGIYGGMD